MTTATQTVVQEILDHIRACGDGACSNWYVGIASQPRQRLFVDHNVDEQNGAWIFKQCGSSNEARFAEYYLINNHGAQGGPGGGDDTTNCIYAYRITQTTKE